MARRRKGKLVTSVALLLLGGGLVIVAAGIAMRPRDATSQRHRAEKLRDAGDVEGAIAAFDRAVELEENRPRDRARFVELLVQRGQCNLRFDRADKACQDFQRAQALEPGDPTIWELVGRALVAQEKWNQAALQFEEAALAFPDRERWFRWSAACAHYSLARDRLADAKLLLAPRSLPGREEDLDEALARVASTAQRPPSRDEVEHELLMPPYGTGERDRAFALLKESRAEFTKADQQFSDYELAPDLDVTFGRIRMEMHLHAGRWYELRRTAELLLRVPVLPTAEDDLLRLETTLAHGLRRLGLADDAAKTFFELRRRYNEIADEAKRQGDSEEVKRTQNLAYRCHVAALEDRLVARQGAEAVAMLDWIKDSPPTHLLHQFYAGYAQYLAGDKAAGVVGLERAANLLVANDGQSWQFRDAGHRAWVYDSLVEGLAACGRPELAARIAGYGLRDARDRAPLLAKRTSLLRPLRDHLDEVVGDDYELLKLRRDHGRNLTQWEEDWVRLRGGEEKVAKLVADQAQRVVRVYARMQVQDPLLAAFAKSVGGVDPHARRRAPGGALETSGAFLLREVELDPGLALEVYRALVVDSKTRAQAHLLLVGLAQDQRDVADFRLLLAEHDVADGRLDDAADELALLLAQQPQDLEIATLAYRVARDRNDRDTVRTIVEQTLGEGPTATGRVIAARSALDDGYASLAIAAAKGAVATTPEGRALLGLAARALVATGDLDAAEKSARSVLAQPPLEPSSAAALLTVLARRPPVDGVSPCDAFLDANAAETARVDVESLVDLARDLFEAGAFAATEKVARAVLARSPHQEARLLLSDALLGEGRYDDALATLSPDRATPFVVEETKRLVLVRLARDGAEAAWKALREQLLVGAPEHELARWQVYCAVASGHGQVAIDSLVRDDVVLDDLEERFVALALLAHQSALDEHDVPSSLMERARSVSLKSATRDRELERWLSLDLASPDHRFLSALLELLLREDVRGLEPLARATETRLLTTWPSLGFLARRRALALDADDRPADAAALLARQVEEDPDDVDTLRQLVPFAGELAADVRGRVVAAALKSQLERSQQAVIVAWDELAQGSRAHAASLLHRAAEDPAAKPAALVALADVESQERRMPHTVGGDRAPWCETADRLRLAIDQRQADRELAAVAQDPATDPVVLRSISRRLRGHDDRMDPATKQLVVEALTSRPGPWYGAYDAAVDRALAVKAPSETLESIAKSIADALAHDRGPTVPAAAIGAVARIAEGLHERGELAESKQWLDFAARACPIEPTLLAAQGRIALAQEDTTTARRCFDRAAAFGGDDPDTLAWLGEYTLAERRRPEDALAFCATALAGAKEPDRAALRLNANETTARAEYVVGRPDRSRAAWLAVVKECDDPQRVYAANVALALETFARGSLDAARKLLAPLAEQNGPAQELAKRLVALCDEKPVKPAPKAAAAANAAPPPAPPAEPKPAAKPKGKGKGKGKN
jgi:tetratricopeptide (TPR) repeat protein